VLEICNAASVLLAGLRRETKGLPAVLIAEVGLVESNLTLPVPRSCPVKAVAGKIGHGGNRRWQATAGPQRESVTAGQGNVGKENRQGSYGRASNGENGNGESRRYRRNRNGQGVCPARANRNGLP
jgi:hypothetical protein